MATLIPYTDLNDFLAKKGINKVVPVMENKSSGDSEKNSERQQLDRIANNLPINDNEKVRKRQNNRKRLNKMRNTAGKIVGGRIAECGKKPITWGANKQIALVREVEHPENIYFTGLTHCGSVWSCPSCALKIMDHRAYEVRNVMRNLMEECFELGFITLTVPHGKYNTALELKDLVANVWTKILAKRKFIDLKEQYQIEGYIRALEVTYGENGFHPHLHIVIAGKAKDLEPCAKEIFAMWQYEVRKRGYGECNEKAFKYLPIKSEQMISEYISKWDVSKELTEGHLKNGKTSAEQTKGGRTPFQILSDISEGKSLDPQKDSDIFKEFSLAFKGARQLTWSRELRKNYFFEPEKTDDEIVKEQKISKILLVFTLEMWKRIVSKNIACDIINSYEIAGESGVLATLKIAEISFTIKGNMFDIK